VRSRSLEIAEALCNKRKPNEAVPYLVKAMEDGNNMDAFVQCAFLCPTLDESVECLETGIKKGALYYQILLNVDPDYIATGRAALKRALWIECL
jgi:hypothetical protein